MKLAYFASIRERIGLAGEDVSLPADIGTVADLSQADFYCRPSCRGQSVKGGESVVAVPGGRA